MGVACCSQQETGPDVAGDVPTQKPSASSDTEAKSKAKPKQKSKPKSKALSAIDLKVKPITAALQEVRSIQKQGLAGNLSGLRDEFAVQRNIWQIPMYQKDAAMRGCIDKLKVKVAEVLQTGTSNLAALQKGLEEIPAIAKQAEDSLSNPMSTLIAELIKACRAQPYRLKLISTLERLEKEVKVGSDPKKLALSSAESEPLIKGSQLGATLVSQLQAILAGKAPAKS